jgi:hypothetical protein
LLFFVGGEVFIMIRKLSLMFLISALGFPVIAEENSPAAPSMDAYSSAHQANAHRAPNEAPTLITDVLAVDPEAKIETSKEAVSKTDATQVEKQVEASTGSVSEAEKPVQPENRVPIQKNTLSKGIKTEQSLTEKTAVVEAEQPVVLTDVRADERNTGTKETSGTIKNERTVEQPREASTVKSEATTEQQANVDLQVLEFVLTNQVVNLEPQEVVETFSEGRHKGFVFARIASKAPEELSFVWFHNDRERSRIKVIVQASKNWRTFSFIHLRAGAWKVQLVDNNNKVLGEKTFTIK